VIPSRALHAVRSFAFVFTVPFAETGPRDGIRSPTRASWRRRVRPTVDSSAADLARSGGWGRRGRGSRACSHASPRRAERCDAREANIRRRRRGRRARGPQREARRLKTQRRDRRSSACALDYTRADRRSGVRRALHEEPGLLDRRRSRAREARGRATLARGAAMRARGGGSCRYMTRLLSLHHRAPIAPCAAYRRGGPRPERRSAASRVTGARLRASCRRSWSSM
jgi:hypothetical protein